MSLMLLGDIPQSVAMDIDAIRASKRVVAVRIEEPIRIDGVLDEAAWQLAEPATGFYQQIPVEFEPGTRDVEVRFLYDATTLYIGAVLHDEAPNRLIINDLKRDFSGFDGDLFGVILDTFLDRRNAYGFQTNPGGAQRDVLAFDSGRRSDTNWHGVWFVRTAIGPDGWTVEMAIPFTTLRFPDRGLQEWGLNLVRLVRRDNERTTWAPVPRQFSHYNTAYAGVLTGISGIASGRGVQVKPFATAGLQNGDNGESGWEGDADGGLDLKWGVSSGLVLDGTLRTDFSQVEADEQQINLTRFSLFFPEKREFFLENPASFQIGIAERDNREPRRDLVPFFSRRIGLSAEGEPIPVAGGVRLTGRAGRQGIGLLTMQTSPFEGRPADTFTALRMTRDLTATASAGVFYFGRERAGSDFNRVAGVDLRYTPLRTLQVEAFAMASSTAGVGDWAGQGGLLLDARAHRARVGMIRVGETFQHDLGFVRRGGVATAFLNYSRLLRRDAPEERIREHSFGLDAEVTTDQQYTHVLTRVASLNYGAVFADGAELKTSVTTTSERLQVPFEVGNSGLTVAPGEHRFEEAALKFQSNKSAAVSGSIDAAVGEFWHGTQRLATGGIRVRGSAHLAVQASIGRRWIELPEGSYAPTLVGARFDYSFSPRMSLNAFVQYNGGADAWFSNVRFNLIHRPLSDIYVVWNEIRLAGSTRRALLLKYTHLIAF